LLDIVYNAQSWRDMDYKVTKAILTDMVGEADFKEIVNENPEKYMPLVTPLKEHGMDLQALKTDTRSKVLDKNSGLEKQVSDLKANIKAFDESGKKIANAEELKTAKEQIKSIDTEISELEKQKTTSASELIRQYDGEISGKQNKIYERENVLRTAHEEEIKKIKDTSLEKNLKSKQDSCMGFQKERIELSEKIGNKEREKSKTESSLESKKGKLEEQEKKLGKLRTEWKELKHPDIKYTCPNCQKSFTIGEVKEYQESLKPKLEQVDKDGKETTQNIKGFQEGIESLELEVAVLDKTILGLQNSRIQLDTNIKNLEGEIETLQEKIKKQTSTLPILNFETDETILSLKKEIEEIKGKKQTALTDYTQHISDLSTKIDGLKLKKQPFTDVLNLESTARSYQQSAEESRKKLEIVNRNLQTQKDIEVLVKELEKEMYERLDEKVQGVFGSNFRFKLWKLNVTDGTYDTRLCEIYVRDIKDRFINIRNINTGMFPIRANELIGKIKAHYGIPKSFILVDELGTLDMEHREIVKSFGEQIFATQKGESADIIETLF
jgi:chromosome segregation ATPase